MTNTSNDMESMKLHTNLLMTEATNIINQHIFKLPPGIEDPVAQHLVECIVNVAMLSICQTINESKLLDYLDSSK